jgi:hypothetical protein
MDYHLIVPLRPANSFGFTIDYINERTAEAVGSTIEYALSDLFDIAYTGNGDKLLLLPGQDLYFRVKATASNFASEAFHLVVDERPSAPSVSINYYTEYTNENITSDMTYSTDSLFTVSSSGSGNKITITPGQDLYFKIKATDSNFTSDWYLLDVPERPATPVATIDYAAETTLESFPATVEYSKNANYSAPISCTGTPIALTPGQDLWIWIKPTLHSFASMDYHLVVPEMPYLEYTGGPMINTYPFAVRAILVETMTGFDLTDVSVTNGQVMNLRGDNSFDVYPEQKSEVHVIIPFNTFGGASFASNEVVVYFDSTMSAVPPVVPDNFSIYPNPSHDGMIIIRTTVDNPYTIDVISGEGSLIKSVIAWEKEYQQLNLQGLPRGVYYLRIRANDTLNIQKVILE